MKRYQLGRKISFVCVAKGHPRPTITWMKDGLELDAYAGYAHVSYCGKENIFATFILSEILSMIIFYFSK